MDCRWSCVCLPPLCGGAASSGLWLPGWSFCVANHGPMPAVGAARRIGDSTIRLVTCNLKGCCYDNAALNDLIATSAPDIVTLQGCYTDSRIRWPEGWHFIQKGELLVASRYPVREVTLLSGPRIGHVFQRPNVYYCLVSMPQGDAAVCSVHLPSPHYGLAEVMDRHTLISTRGSPHIEKEIESRTRQAETAVELADDIHSPLILAGDFNMTADSPTYRQTWARFDNAFSRCGFGLVIPNAPTSLGWPFGIRIDHVLCGPNWRPCRCWVGPELGSDHLPLIADLAWRPAGGQELAARGMSRFLYEQK